MVGGTSFLSETLPSCKLSGLRWMEATLSTFLITRRVLFESISRSQAIFQQSHYCRHKSVQKVYILEWGTAKQKYGAQMKRPTSHIAQGLSPMVYRPKNVSPIIMPMIIWKGRFRVMRQSLGGKAGRSHRDEVPSIHGHDLRRSSIHHKFP